MRNKGCKMKTKSLAVMALLLIGSMPIASYGIYYCGACSDVWSSAPTVPDDTCREWHGIHYVEHYYRWFTTTTTVEGAPYDGTLKAWDDFRCEPVPDGVNPYKVTYATVSQSGTTKSVSHTWSGSIKFSPVKDVLEIGAGCSTSNSTSFHCDEGCSWTQQVTGNFNDGEETKFYPRWIDTTITVTGPAYKFCFEGPIGGWNIICTTPLGTKTATKVEKAIAATFKHVKVDASCTECDEPDEWCDGTDCSTECCDHNQQ